MDRLKTGLHQVPYSTVLYSLLIHTVKDELHERSHPAQVLRRLYYITTAAEARQVNNSPCQIGAPVDVVIFITIELPVKMQRKKLEK